MTTQAVVQLCIYFGVLLVLSKPLGLYMARVYEGDPTWLGRWFGPCERLCHRIAGVRADEEMGWKRYAVSMLAFNLVGLLVVYALQRLQGALPLNPQALPATTPDLAFNTAVSFATNTNWQSYGGETTLSYLTQMLGLTVQNFVSAASGMAVLVALARGLTRRSSAAIGNFWVDLVRGTLLILVPMSVVLALLLVSQGVVQTFSAYREVPLLQASQSAGGTPRLAQLLALGPAASQIAIKQLGTNGGGFFNVNSAHPFENPTALASFLELLAILLIPAALCHTFGKLVKDARQGWALLGAMLIIFVPLLVLCCAAEQAGNPVLHALGVDQVASALSPGGNMEGKEARFGIVGSALWATATTAASNGSVNAMHDSFTPLGGLAPLWLIQLGEIIFGGVGSGLYGMLMFVIVAVFVAGLMVGRTPEYLGKKIEAYEMKMAALVILIPAALVLVFSAIGVLATAGKAGILNPGAHGFSEVLYAFSSAANNNGSAFAGLSANTPFYNTLLGVAMFGGRYLIKVAVL
ncbi:MAG TPA: potassium-transporting ATPase subunit KdpA, partial [Polyangiaceae bacterium]|nr:potassium-transporting ATPase subunit KdpA [Polyangiaceae bacterium]